MSELSKQSCFQSMFRAKRVLRCACVMVAMIALNSTGCNKGVVFNPGSLPQQFAAVPPAHPAMFNLARFAQANSRSELVHPGDLLEVTVATGLEAEKPTTWALRVADSGELTVPLVGSVMVAGVEPTDCERIIRVASIDRGLFVNPNVTVELKDRKRNRVSVVGAVNEPGIKNIPVGQSDLFNALVAAGGLAEDAATTVEIRHPDGTSSQVAQGNGPNAQMVGFRQNGNGPVNGPMTPRQMRYDLRDVAAGRGGDFHVEDGTMIVVSKKPTQYIQVIGLVRKPDQFEIKAGQEYHLLDALAKSNGRTLEVADKVRVIRRVPNKPEPIVIEASIRKAKSGEADNLLLAPGDVVSVEETPVTFVVGTIRDFVRFGFTSAIPGI